MMLGDSSLQAEAVAAVAAVDIADMAKAVLDSHLQLDAAIKQQLQAVIGDTDGSAMMLIRSMRKLNDDAVKVVEYIGHSTQHTGTLEQEIAESVGSIAQIAHFVEELPEVMTQDAALIRGASKEIGELSLLVDLIKDIARRTNMVAINASIEAHHAGRYGRSFKVVADEIRRLADHAAQATTRIEQGLKHAQKSVQAGLDQFSTHSSQQTMDAGKVVKSIRHLQENYEDMRQYYKTLFSVVNRHNVALASELAEMLGQIQYQDVVRQRIERIATAVTQRNAVLQALVDGMDRVDPAIRTTPQQMQLVLDDYLQEEQRHAPVAAEGEALADLPKFELF